MSKPVPRVTALAFALALHLLCLLIVTWPFRLASSGAADTESQMKTAAIGGPVETPRRDEVDAHLPSPSNLRVYGFQFDLRKIRARWDALFPFVTTNLSFDNVANPRRAAKADGLVFADPIAELPPAAPASPRLAMSDAAIQQLTDRSWSRRDRWTHFAEYVRLASAYHPDAGRLPSVLRAYAEQNALQPYTDTSFPDPRRWAMLGLAADHQDFIDFVVPYVRQHPSTRTTTELLFLLDELTQGSRDALVLLLETNPRQQMAWTHEENREAYQLFDSLHEYYKETLTERGFGSIDAVKRKYDEVRLQLLSTVVRLTPDAYRASDAWFLIGQIHWRRGDTAEAVQAWRRMAIVPDDSYVDTYAQVLETLGRESGGSSGNAQRIEAILDAGHRKWVDFSFDRLARFGYGFDMF
jgi:hypothetical protein